MSILILEGEKLQYYTGMRGMQLRRDRLVLMLGIAGCLILITGAACFAVAQSYEQVVPKAAAASRRCHPSSSTTLASSTNPQLKALAEYANICGELRSGPLMTFAAMPSTEAEAQVLAAGMARRLQEFSAYAVEPLVVFEPPLDKPAYVSEMKSGIYDESIRQYYQHLRNSGITDAQLGTWVLFPEANTASWITTDPGDFTSNVTAVASMQKQVFPGSSVSILLNCRTYPDNDTEWQHGRLESLLPYTDSIPKGLVDSFGYQGFPSVSAANSTVQYSLMDPRQFLPVSYAAEAARQLGVTRIWLNTGTFSTIYTGDPGAQVAVGQERRKDMLAGILDQAGRLEKEQFTVSINLFSADKSNLSEGINWTYWPAGQPTQRAGTPIVRNFLNNAYSRNVGISLYVD